MKLLTQLREHPVLRYVSYAIAILTAIVAAGIVALFAIDLGPLVKERAEQAGSKQIERPIHIGSLKIQLFSGKVLVENLVIDGLHKGDRPFFTAKRLALAFDWLPLLPLPGRYEKSDFAVTDVDLTDWQMLVEKWEDEHNFPKFSRDDKDEPAKERPVSVTLKWLHASRGQFTFEDHEAPWSIVCPNLDITIGNLPNYHGTARFSEGLVTIQDNVPMWANMKAQFVLDGPRVHLQRIDLDTDGARTVARGDVDLANWPNQTYRVQSRVSFPRMREIFFKSEDWRLTGDGDFNGTFSLFKGGRRDLAGTFASEVFGFGEYRFPSLFGSLRWTQNAFDVWDAGSKFYGGDARFTYAIKPLGSKTRPTARFDASYADVDLARFTDFQRLPGMRFAGNATGHNLLEWPLGRFVEHRGGGDITVVPPAGVAVMTPTRAAERAAAAVRQGTEWGPFTIPSLPSHVPIAGSLTYRYTPDDVTLESGRFATEGTDVTFGGTTAWGERARIPFHVVSADWQESDLLLAGIISDFGSPTHGVSFGGRGEFDGVMTGPFRRPRVEGRFTGDDLRAWDTHWGSGACQLVVENSYVTITDGVVTHDGSEIHANGKFSLGYPRDDTGEEIDARFRAVRRDLDSLRHAFKIDDYPVSGLFSGEFHLTGEYERPLGFGTMTIDDGVAYGEPFQQAKAALRFDGTGARLDNISLAKSTGTVTGAAYVGWDSTYSFNADGRQLPIADLAFLNYPKVPLSGSVDFTANGAGTFDFPRNDVKGITIRNMRIGEEEVGDVSGNLVMRGKELSGDLIAASPRFSVTGQGHISLTPRSDADIQLRFHESSLDPYVRLFLPNFAPYTTAVVSGSVHAAGQLADFDTLAVEATVDTLDMRLLDFAVHNPAPIKLSLARQRIAIDELQLVGENTQLRLTGSVGLKDQRIEIQATGDADLGILQGFLGNIRGAGRAELRAAINGALDTPQFSGTATIANGRIRHFSMPNALDAINGTIHFDPDGVRLDDVTATMGGGKVQFGGRIGFDGFVPGDLNITARGQDMHVRYPEDIRSVIDADLAVRGTFKAPELRGEVTVKSATWNRRVNVPTIYDLAARRSAAIDGGGGSVEPAATTVPLRFDVHIAVPSTLRIDNNLARIVASADMSLRGTYDRPVLLGHADVERGEVIFEGRRYKIRRGTIDFTNPNKIEPFFDVEAETSVRQYSQNYRITVTAAGTTEQLRPTFDSDPPLPPADVLTLLLSEARSPNQNRPDVELRALANPNERSTNIIAAQGTQYLLPAQKVGDVVEQTFGLDTFQLTPSLIDPYGQQTSRLNPTARVTIGKRISDRAYLTFSRSLGSIQSDQVVMLEYEANDRLSWVLSRNEDQQTFTLEFRVRHIF